MRVLLPIAFVAIVTGQAGALELIDCTVIKIDRKGGTVTYVTDRGETRTYPVIPQLLGNDRAKLPRSSPHLLADVQPGDRVEIDTGGLADGSPVICGILIRKQLDRSNPQLP